MSNPTGNPNGRPANPQTQAEAQVFTEQYIARNLRKYLNRLDAIATKGEDNEARLAIATLLERGLGRPAQPERNDSLSKLTEVLKQVARIANREPEEPTRNTLVVSEARALGDGGEGAAEAEESVDFSEAEGNL